jgi:hypothetical protein
MATPLEDLQEFENEADRTIANLTLWKQPLRSVLSMVYLAADGKYVGMRFHRGRPRNEELGTAMILRLSYVARFFGGCSRELGENVDDALSVADGRFASEIEQLLAYAHFCEIMPLVRRGFLVVERDACSFKLKHPGEEFQRHEENDVLMSELALPHDQMPPPRPIEGCLRMVKAWPEIPGDALVGVLREVYEHHVTNVVELALLGEEPFQEVFGFSRVEFIRVRAGLMAYSDFCLGMADAAELLSRRSFTRRKRELLQREVREWAAPLLNRNHIIGTVAGLSGVSVNVAERVVDAFTIDPDDVEKSGVGEGFFPPFLRLDDALLFSPHAVKRTMPERNLLYAMLRTDQRKFDEVVSRHLEPAIVAEAAAILSELPDVEVRTNVQWRAGEIDLVAYHAGSNSALQIQAKAGVPPEGARMLARVEARTIEAANQLESFLDLPDDEKDAICGAAFATRLTAVRWQSAVLVRTCLGTENAWNRIEAFAPLNPVLLRVVVRRMRAEGEFTFLDFGARVEQELSRFRSEAVTGWENKSLKLLGVELVVPLLQLKLPAVTTFRANAMSNLQAT